jgi:hypothetical protein
MAALNVDRRPPHPSKPICANSMLVGRASLSRLITRSGRLGDAAIRDVGKVLSRERPPRPPATRPCVDGREVS